MTPDGPDVHPSPQNPAGRAAVARPGKRAARSSRGWSAPDRAPGLRRAAELVEIKAKRTGDAVQRLRLERLARDLRIRAADIELAGDDALGDAMEQFRASLHDFAVL